MSLLTEVPTGCTEVQVKYKTIPYYDMQMDAYSLLPSFRYATKTFAYRSFYFKNY